MEHVRWIAGGTGAGKSTVTRLLAERYDLAVYDGDRAEQGWRPRYTPERYPYFHALSGLSHDERVRLTPEETFRGMPSLHGETIDLVVDDLLALSTDRVVLVDFFGNLPKHVAPLLARPEHAVFLLPTPEFRHRALRDRYSDPARARRTTVTSILSKRSRTGSPGTICGTRRCGVRPTRPGCRRWSSTAAGPRPRSRMTSPTGF
nr:hypothetical protein [Kibdelosporangium sp. MJ126-NF4]